MRKGKAGHGVSVVEIASDGGKWSIVKDSPYNRRITADTPMEITGPARGHDLLKTAADPDGVSSLGTWNNCGNGRTPWGTYLACEENFNGYYSSSDPDIEIGPAFKRYGVGVKDWGYAWATADERFDIAKHPNESNRNGYVVEINPLDPASTPKKRTALGRFKHENAEVVVAANGQVVAYMGDDERGEFLYKFVSDGMYAEGGDNADLLASGRLFVGEVRGRRPRGMGRAHPRVNRPGVCGGGLHPYPDRRFRGGGDHHGPPGVGGRASDEGGGLLLPHQQQEPRQEAERGR